MTDIVDGPTRSRMMSGIRAKNTKPEVDVRRALHARGFRFRLHDRRLPGRPDIVLARFSAVVFIHGCFWHGHDCRYFKVPKTRPEFWLPKIEQNRVRDRKHIGELNDSEWRVATVWECALRGKTMANVELVVERLSRWLRGGTKNIEIRE